MGELKSPVAVSSKRTNLLLSETSVFPKAEGLPILYIPVGLI